MKEIYGDGKLRDVPEQSGAFWTFVGNQLSMSSPAGESSRFTVTPIRDARGTALWLKSDDSAAVAESGWMIYELVDGTLKVAFSGRPGRSAGELRAARRQEGAIVRHAASQT